jgi:hypothetical protein
MDRTKTMADDDEPVIQSFKTCIEVAESLATQWDLIDLKNLRVSLDAQAEKIAEELEARRSQRKMLMMMAKNFKLAQQNGPILMEQTDELIRAFKEEVDATTRRAKSAESAFLGLYRLFREESLADPAVVFRKMADLGKSSLDHLMCKAEPTAKLERQVS